MTINYIFKLLEYFYNIIFYSIISFHEKKILNPMLITKI